MNVQMADVQRAQQSPCEPVAHQAALQVVPTTLPAMPVAPMEVEQPMQIDMATPHASQLESGQCRRPPDPTVVVSWLEAQLLELATSLPAVRTMRHLRQRTCTIPKKLLHHHTHCHHQRVKRRDPKSLQAEVAAARGAWLGPTLLVRAYEGSQQADGANDMAGAPKQEQAADVRVIN